MGLSTKQRLRKSDVLDTPLFRSTQMGTRASHDQQKQHIDYGYRYHPDLFNTGFGNLFNCNALLPAKTKFVQVPRKMLGAQIMENAHTCPLKQGGKRFGRIAMDLAPTVLAL